MIMRVRTLVLVLALAGAFAAGAAAQGGWRVFATASDSGEYGAFVSANANTIKPRALAARASAKADLSWSIYCSGETKNVAANKIVTADVGTSAKCTLTASASADGAGTVRLQLLRR